MYDPADDARPVSEQAHGVLSHTAAMLNRYDAESQGEGIKVDDLDSSDAEEIVASYTLIDSLLDSEDWDQRTMVERIDEKETGLESYGSDGKYSSLGS